MKGTTRLNSLALGKVPFLLVFLFCFVSLEEGLCPLMKFHF